MEVLMKKILFAFIAICFLSSCTQDYFYKTYGTKTETENSENEEQTSTNEEECESESTTTESAKTESTANETENVNDKSNISDKEAAVESDTETSSKNNSSENTETSTENESDVVEKATGKDENESTIKEETKPEKKTSTEDQSSTEDEPSIEIPEKKWTLIVYMAADNNLESACIADLNEMEAANITEDVSVLALVDRSSKYDLSNENWSDTRLYEITKDSEGLNQKLCSKQIDCPELELSVGVNKELNMSDENVLKNLILFSKEKYKAKNYGFVVWGHGTGYRSGKINEQIRAVAVDDESSDIMSLSKFHEAIINSEDDNTKLSFIAFDTCFGAELENAYELKDCAYYLAGVEGTTPYGGWNYEEWFNNCDFNSTESISILNSLKNQYKEDMNYFSIIDLSKIENVFEKYEAFALEVTKKIDSAYRQNKIFKTITESASTFYASGEESSLYVDIYSMSQKILKNYSSIKSAADLQTSIKDALVNTNSENEIYPLGINFCVIDADGTIIKKLPDSYIQGSGAQNQCMFVKDSACYVPNLKDNKTLLNYLFYKTFTK